MQACLLISRYFPGGMNLISKVHFLVKIGTTCCNKCYFSALQVNFPGDSLFLMSNVPWGTFVPGDMVIPDPRVTRYLVRMGDMSARLYNEAFS